MKIGLSDREFSKLSQMDNLNNPSRQSEVHDGESECDFEHHKDENHVSTINILSFNRDSNNDVIMDDTFFAYFCMTGHDGMRELMLNGNNLFLRVGRRLHDDDIQHLLNFLRKNINIVSINLAYNCIQCGGFIDMIDYIIVNNNVSELNVQNNDIGPIGIEKMCENGGKLNLKILRLNGNKFGCGAAKKIALMLCKNSHIEHLDIAEVDQTISSLICFITIMKPDLNEFNNTLKILDISRPNPTGMFNYNGAQFAAVVGSMLKTNKCLRELHLQKFNFSCHDIELMLHDGLFNNSLLLLDLSCNNIGDHGIESICQWFYRRPALAGIMLSHNIMTATGARALSFALPFSRIRFLDISHNRIDDTGTADILNTIKKSTWMRHLRLFGNKIGHDTAQIAHRMLKSGVLVQEYLDIKPYYNNEECCVAYYPAHHYKQRYYNVGSGENLQPVEI